MGDDISINTAGIKENFSKVSSFFKQKKVQTILIVLLFLIILIGSSTVRLQNLPLLVDQTTGESLPLALDPFYFLRIAETIVEEGGLPAIDVMRYPSANVGFTNEVLPQALVFLYNIGKIFDGDVSLQFINVVSPVIFFGLGLVIFFFLIYVLTKSKGIALFSSAFLAFIPTYLHRTLAGFSDHEAIGMFAFFLFLLGYGLALKFLDRGGGRKNFIKILLFGLLVGFFSSFAVASWGGGANFIFMILPLSFGLFWLLKVQNLENTSKEQLKGFLLFYFSWIFFSILTGLLFGFSLQEMIGRVLFRSSSLISGAVFLFLLADFSLINFGHKINFIREEGLKKYRVLYSLLIVVLIGIIFLLFQGNLFSFISNILDRFVDPLGASRAGLTVAENKQPFLEDWINQIGKIFFWFFYVGMLFVGINISKGINKKGKKILFFLLWTLAISGILFSRISSTSLLNGTNFISKLFYLGAIILFLGYSFWIYFKERIRVKSGLLILASWLFLMLIAGRGAVRLFFVITPFATFMGGYFLVNLFNYAKKSKDDFLRMILVILLILSVIGTVITLNSFISVTSAQAEHTGPSAGLQWQSAMSWVRENTILGSIFVHWWDYGYWIQYLGERPTITDGGHAVPYWDHLIGRYLLTTPDPETALSFMKSHNVSYLLIDPTDLGKYGAYGIIGSDEINQDRFSQIPTMILDPNQIQETSDKEIRFYQGGTMVDEDIIYEQDGQEIFLPANKAAIAGTILEFSENNGKFSFNRPSVVFVYNNQQIIIPIRYVYFRGELFDMGGGLDAVIRTLPSASQTGPGIQIDDLGSVIYLSPRVSKSLFAQLYLMNDPFNIYPTIKVAHRESDLLVSSLRSQGANMEDILFFNGFRGPIKIFEIDYPENILEKEEFLRISGKFAEFDDLKFTA